MPFGFSLHSPGPPPPMPKLPAELVSLVPLPSPVEKVDSTRKTPPPTDTQRNDELNVSRAFEKARTPEGNEWAEYMAKFGGTTLWKDEAKAMRSELGKWAGYKATGAVAAAMGSTLLNAFVRGPKYERDRPFELDPTLTTVGGRPGTSSYPSGHAAQAYAMATVISAAAPWRAEREMELARQSALSRVYAGVHLPSDVAAGARLGKAVGEKMVKRFHIHPAEEPKA